MVSVHQTAGSLT